ncbi:unnamed protein product [Chilo suppressalis]|uniref:Odorant receptor n=1 Tax=Chilo suppressalis TaxID=168631 RepID=A0ABN8BJP1_CHISP|nr:unnamed protein product [Chilo suppressalis]
MTLVLFFRFINEINNALNLGLTMNFMTLSLALCLIIYYMTSAPVFSFEFAFMFSALIVLQFENFLYSYHGQLVQNESDSVNTAIYCSDWLSVSPKFRRLILIAMCRWHYRLIPRVLNIIPISFSTLLWITRTNYTIYTLLKSYERS